MCQIVRNKRTLIFFFPFLVLSGKFGKQFFRFCVSITFILDITVFVDQNKNAVDHMIERKQDFNMTHIMCRLSK
jgi:hypothetical protein